MPREADSGRLFLGLWPGPAVRDALAEWSWDLSIDRSARRVAPDNLHVTLAFLGPLDAPRLEAVRRVAAGTAWTPGTLELDRIGYWKRSGIVWAGSRRGCEPLNELAEGLRADLRRIGFRIDSRPFVPHVTLARKARRRPKWSPRAVAWRVEALCLVRSHLSSAGARYEILDRWSASGDVK